MSNVSINTISQRLEKRFKVMGVDKAREHAIKLVSKLKNVAEQWREDIYEILSTPAVLRGYSRANSKWLNLHNSLRYNRGFPMMVSGLLRKSIYQRVALRNTIDGAEISVSRGFKNLGTGSVSGYRDYGEFLDQEHGTLTDWKKRAYDKLDARIRQLTRIKNG